MKKIILTVFLIVTAQLAWAIDLHDAKDQGLVGEAVGGYLAAVKTPASDEVLALIEEVNAKRRAEFERTAAKTNTTLLQVSYRFYQLAVERTEPGHYYQDENGRWVRK
jgi:uncharacterized protein YdbL (DUF1318 family)